MTELHAAAELAASRLTADGVPRTPGMPAEFAYREETRA